MAYLVLTYPNLIEKDFDLIQKYRKQNDALYFSVVNPHFTIIFPVDDQPEKEFVDEINRMCKGQKKIEFTLRCAIVNKDAFKDYYHTFLVPDEGFSKIIKLHDRLYSDRLVNNRRLDLDYIPHLGIGNSKDKFICKEMADEWNSNDFAIPGQLSHLTIAHYKDNKITKVNEIELG